jgi:hypothetical protein
MATPRRVVATDRAVVLSMSAPSPFIARNRYSVVGSNENTNGLLQYFPRGTDFSRISQSYLNAIVLRLNQRPRKTLGFGSWRAGWR